MVCVWVVRERATNGQTVCEGGVGCHRWMTKRKEQRKVVDGRERSGM